MSDRRRMGLFRHLAAGLLLVLGTAAVLEARQLPANLVNNPAGAGQRNEAVETPWKSRPLYREPADLLPGVRLVPPNGAVEISGVKLVGVTAENGYKLLFTLAFIALAIALKRGLKALERAIHGDRPRDRSQFWTKQGIDLALSIVLVVGLASIWFDDPTRLTTALGLVTAGLAFALQKVVTSLAGYVVILRGQTFNVGDRITMGGVRGDVIALGFIQTTIMEMGQPPAVQSADPAMWVRSRQYTGRIVTVSNDKIFDEPVYNYTRDFPYIWEEISIPIAFTADRDRAEQVLLDAAHHHSVDVASLCAESLRAMERRYFLKAADVGPRVYWRLTGNWLELSVRFIVSEHGIREVKDAISRDILKGLDEAGIGMAYSTLEIVNLPPLRIDTNGLAATAADSEK